MKSKKRYRRPRPPRTGSSGDLVRSADLRTVLRSDFDDPLYVHVARLSVLYQDMRLESRGISEEGEIQPLDETQPSYRRLYFLRRHIATLFEFSGALKSLDACKSFRPIKSDFGEGDAAKWAEAIQFFSHMESHSLLKKVRNDIGGHFLLEAARHGVRELPPIEGSIEIAISEKGLKRFRLLFAGDVALTAAVKHPEGATPLEKLDRLVKKAGEAMVHANMSATLVVKHLLWPQFGTPDSI